MIPSFSKPHLPDRECWLRPADNDHHTCWVHNVTIDVHFESNGGGMKDVDDGDVAHKGGR